LYKKAHVSFTDITSGSAKGCSEIGNGQGFPALPGWDAVTGFGTPRFQDILKALKIDGTFSKKGGYGGQWV
jgi:tripeptidyl-peptidase-1